LQVLSKYFYHYDSNIIFKMLGDFGSAPRATWWRKLSLRLFITHRPFLRYAQGRYFSSQVFGWFFHLVVFLALAKVDN